MKDKKLIVVAVSILAILIGVIGITYAYFTTQIEGNDSNQTSVIVTTGLLEITYDVGNIIMADKVLPGWTEEKTFKVTSNASITMSYNIVFMEVINTFVTKNDLIYELFGENEKGETIVPEEDVSILTNINIEPGEEHTYRLKIIFKNREEAQDENMGKSFSGKVQITTEHMNSLDEGDSPQRTNTKLDNVRYIKSCISGSTGNTDNHWVELQAIKNEINVALNKTVTGTTEPFYYNGLFVYSRITDGIVDYDVYAQSSIGGLQCIAVDLETEYDLDEIGLWLYWGDGRKYYQNTLSVGSTNVAGTIPLETVLHTYSGTDGYVETSLGKRYTAWD